MVAKDNFNGEMDMEKILDQLLMPPPGISPRASVESLRNPSSHSLDRSNNSSSGSSANASWMSDSSCSCHSSSPQNYNTRSMFVFHKHSILPPLLCSASRTEMQVYRTKAVEKEQKKKLKNKQRLISRVEAILSNVEFSPLKSAPPQVEGPTSPNLEIKTPTKSSDESCQESTPDDATSDSDHHDSESDVADDAVDVIKPNDDVASFHDNAYKSSLRNLLQKSMSLDKGDLLTPGRKNESQLNQEQEESSEEGTSSDSDSEDITDNTVVIMKPILGQKSPNTSPKSTQNLEEDILIDSLIQTVLKDVKNELVMKIEEDSLLQNNGDCDIIEGDLENNETKNLTENNMKTDDLTQNFDTILAENDIFVKSSLWETPNLAENDSNRAGKSPSDISVSQTADLHDQSTSTKLNFPLDSTKVGGTPQPPKLGSTYELDESPILGGEGGTIDPGMSNVIELSGDVCFESTIVESQFVPVETDSKNAESEIDDLTMLHPASSNIDVTMTTETEQLIQTYKQQLENDENDAGSPTEASEKNSPLESGPLTTLHRTSSFTLQHPSKSFESAVIEAVSQHFQGYQEKVTKETRNPNEDRNSKSEEFAAAKQKQMLIARVRRGSYTLDEPSPYLVKNKEGHIISGSPNVEAYSETTEGSVCDVKRRLDLPSDSEESSISERIVKSKKKYSRGAKVADFRPKDSPTIDDLSQDETKASQLSLKQPSLKLEPKLQKDLEILSDNGSHSTDAESKSSSSNKMKTKSLNVDHSRSSDGSSQNEMNLEESSSSTGMSKSSGHEDNESKMSDLCQILHNQHAHQMENLRRKHQEQIVSLKQELAQEHSSKMSQPLDRAVCNEKIILPPIEITISPSRASTEYHDIRIRREILEEYSVQKQISPPPLPVGHDTKMISEVPSSFHKTMCKFSALVKGHLTRKLLQSNKVQEVMQIIRDTSRLILSLRTENPAPSKGMASIRDNDLEERAFNQLHSALYQFHDIFFNVPTSERMIYIAQTDIMEKKLAEKMKSKSHKLSLATQKSLERKRLISSSSEGPPSRPQTGQTKTHHKEVKSKISHIWKEGSVNIPDRKPSHDAVPPKVTSQSKRVMSQKAKSTSQSSTMTSQSSKSPSSSLPSKSSRVSPKVDTRRSHNVTSQNNRVKSQTTRVTSQSSKMTSQNKASVAKKPAPLRSSNNTNGKAR